MNFFQKIKEVFAPPTKVGQPLWETQKNNISREVLFFKDTFRIGILCQYTNNEEHDAITKYKKELDILGYETEVLMFINDKEIPRTVFLPNFCLKDISKQGVPYNPRIDRFIKKKFDMLFILTFSYHEHLDYIAQHSVAKCRYGAYRPELKSLSDVFVYTDEENNLQSLILKINEVFQKQAYERKHI